MKTIITLVVALISCNILISQERPIVTATGTPPPREEVVVSEQPTDTTSSEEEDSKSNQELLLELLEKSRKERVGYFQVSEGLIQTYKVEPKSKEEKQLVAEENSKIVTLEKEIQNLKIRLEINKAAQKEYAKKADSLSLSRIQTNRLEYISDSIMYISKENSLKEMQMPKISFDTIRLYLLDARLNRIVVPVINENGFYSNKIPITITSFNTRTQDKLFYQGTNKKLIDSYIIIGELLNYTCLTERITYPPDTNICISVKKPIAPLYNTGKQLEYFDVRLYTDTKGLSGESNGLIQTEINASFYGSTKNWSNHNITSVPFVRLHLGISKFDSKFDTLQLNSLSNRLGTDYLRMTQYSNLNLRVETDVIRYSRIHDGYLTVGHQMQSTVISDTNGNSQRVFSPSFYTVLGGTMFSYPRIKCEFKLPIHYSYLMDQPFIEYEKKWEFMIIPEIEVVLDPVKSSGSESEVDGTRIFGRVKYFDLTDYRGGNFWQVQLGAQISLSDVFKK